MNYNPDKDDYLQWKSDWDKREEWLDGTHYSHSLGTYYWTTNYKLHRDDDKPARITSNTLEWSQDGHANRDNDKPALINRWGYRAWYHNGSLHRLYDRPAVITAEGYKEWWKNGNQYFPEIFITYLDRPEFFKNFIHELKKYINIDRKSTLSKNIDAKILSPKIQEKICSINPSLVSLIPKDILSPKIAEEYSAYSDLADLGI